MTGGGIEPTTTGLKAPYRIPFDYPALLEALLQGHSQPRIYGNSFSTNHVSFTFALMQ